MNLDELNFVKHGYVGSVIGSIQFSLAPASSDIEDCLKSGQKWLKIIILLRYSNFVTNFVGVDIVQN